MRLNERTNAIDNLEQVYNFLLQTNNSSTIWKWVIITLDAALYGFSICACAGTNLGTVTIKDGSLIGLNEALKRCQDNRWMKRLSFGKHLVLSPSQKESIRWVHKEFRNKFIHYKPRAWSIELHGIAKIVIDVLDVIRFLAINTGHVRLKTNQKRKVKSLIFQCKKFLKKSPLY